MKLALVLLSLFLIPQLSFGQSLKKKYLGTYSGTIPPYTMDAGGEVVTVKEAKVMLSLEEEYKATQTIDGIADPGSWQLIAVKSDYYEVGFIPENSVVIQKYYLYKKGKKIERDGLYPQPDNVMLKD